jgi:hypothetical protein
MHPLSAIREKEGEDSHRPIIQFLVMFAETSRVHIAAQTTWYLIEFASFEESCQGGITSFEL